MIKTNFLNGCKSKGLKPPEINEKCKKRFASDQTKFLFALIISSAKEALQILFVMAN